MMKRLKKQVHGSKHLSHHIDEPEFGSILGYPLMENLSSRSNLDIVWSGLP